MYDLYFACYIIMIYNCFVGLPFSYFYAQSVQDEEEFKMMSAAQSTKDQPEGEATYTMKNMDSSESSSGEDDDAEKDQDQEKPKTRK